MSTRFVQWWRAYDAARARIGLGPSTIGDAGRWHRLGYAAEVAAVRAREGAS